jgi:hypothetical protein
MAKQVYEGPAETERMMEEICEKNTVEKHCGESRPTRVVRASTR